MTVVDSGFHTVDFGFRVLDSGFQLSGFRIPKRAGVQFCFSSLLDSGFLELDSGFQKRKIRGFWNPDSLTWREVLLQSVLC